MGVSWTWNGYGDAVMPGDAIRVCFCIAARQPGDLVVFRE